MTDKDLTPRQIENGHMLRAAGQQLAQPLANALRESGLDFVLVLWVDGDSVSITGADPRAAAQALRWQAEQLDLQAENIRLATTPAKGNA